MAQVKEKVSTMTVAQLAEVCALGSDFDAEEYRDCTMVTYGTNAWSAVFLSNADSGLVMLQKIATATFLKSLTLIINDSLPILPGTVTETNSWHPYELRTGSDIDFFATLGEQMAQKLGW